MIEMNGVTCHLMRSPGSASLCSDIWAREEEPALCKENRAKALGGQSRAVMANLAALSMMHTAHRSLGDIGSPPLA